jgi:hypothetical protein
VYSADAPLHATQRADELLERGDADRQAVHDRTETRIPVFALIIATDVLAALLVLLVL